MPIMDGPTTAKTLRQMGCDVVIIGLTGYIGPKEIEIFRSAGVNGVIGKPFSIDDLHAAIVDMHGSPHNALTICNDVVDLQQEESGVNMDL
ncbi:SKN7 [Symbiodinium microadriaticum]|nr:SKN7 [Symbiodinium microadriaticum]